MSLEHPMVSENKELKTYGDMSQGHRNQLEGASHGQIEES